MTCVLVKAFWFGFLTWLPAGQSPRQNLPGPVGPTENTRRTKLIAPVVPAPSASQGPAPAAQRQRGRGRYRFVDGTGCLVPLPSRQGSVWSLRRAVAPSANHTVDIVKDIKANGAPIDAVGCQSHGLKGASGTTISACTLTSSWPACR